MANATSDDDTGEYKNATFNDDTGEYKNATFNDDTGEYKASQGLLIFAGFVMIFMIILAIVGNALTIMSFIGDKKLRSVYNVYLLNLAVADFMIGSISMSFHLTYTLWGNVWLYGYHFCKVYLCVDLVACCVTALTMNIISYDRLMLLKKGAIYHSNQTMRKAYLRIAVVWLLAFLLYGPAVIGWDHWTGVNTVEDGDCNVQFADDTIYITTAIVLDFLLPLVCLGILNSLVINEIRRLHLNKVHVIQISTIQTAIDNSGQSEKDKHRSNRARKGARSLAIMVVAFVITWAPYTIIIVVLSFCGDCVSISVYNTCLWILWFKSALNPFLYAFNNVRFRNNFLFFLCCGKRR